MYYFASWLTWLDHYTDTLQHFIASQLVLAPLLLLFIEEMGIPIILPGDAILGYVGYKLSLSHNASEFWPAFIVAQASILGGATILFFLSRRWGQLIITKLAHFVFISDKQITRAEKLFAKRSAIAIIIGRHIPGLRIIITVLAGSSGVSYATFAICTFVSSTAWILIFISIGKKIGTDFHSIIQQYIGLSLALTIAVIVGILFLHIVGLYHESKNTSHFEDL